MNTMSSTATMNRDTLVVLSTCRNSVSDCASVVSALSLAADNTISLTRLPISATAMIATRNIHVPDIACSVPVMIDANHRLAYPLAKRLEGVIDGDSVSTSGDRNGN